MGGHRCISALVSRGSVRSVASRWFRRARPCLAAPRLIVVCALSSPVPSLPSVWCLYRGSRSLFLWAMTVSLPSIEMVPAQS
jgi:hypothetical protein